YVIAEQFPSLEVFVGVPYCSGGVSFRVRSEQSLSSSSDLQDKCERRRVVITLVLVAPWISLLHVSYCLVI
ncbi:unnamed protein product, partial [Brassica rapa]